MNISVITDEVILTPGQKSAVTKFVNKNCSYYYFLNFLRISNGNVSDAIKLYYFDEDLRKVLLKYILRLEVQMKKDLIMEVEGINGGKTFWNDPQYYKRKYTTKQKNRPNSNFIITTNKINAQIKKMNFSSNGPQNNRAFYSTSFGSFIKIYNNLLYQYKTRFISKYMASLQNAEDEIHKYLQCLRTIRNRCCHSNHVVSIKLQNNINSSILYNFGHLGISNFEKCLLFVYKSLDNNKDFKKEVGSVLKKYQKTWIKYQNKQPIRMQTLNLIKNL